MATPQLLCPFSLVAASPIVASLPYPSAPHLVGLEDMASGVLCAEQLCHVSSIKSGGEEGWRWGPGEDSFSKPCSPWLPLPPCCSGMELSVLFQGAHFEETGGYN